MSGQFGGGRRPPSPGCVPSEQVFAAAAALAAFLWANLSTLEVQTLINLLTLLASNLAAMIVQEQLCSGVIVTPPEG